MFSGKDVLIKIPSQHSSPLFITMITSTDLIYQLTRTSSVCLIQLKTLTVFYWLSFFQQDWLLIISHITKCRLLYKFFQKSCYEVLVQFMYNIIKKRLDRFDITYWTLLLLSFSFLLIFEIHLTTTLNIPFGKMGFSINGDSMNNDNNSKKELI